jgi:glycosyltransferase involved in cell wall biosynthesis
MERTTLEVVSRRRLRRLTRYRLWSFGVTASLDPRDGPAITLRMEWPFRRKRKRTSILFFFHETTWSGAPIQLFYLTTWLKARGWNLAAVVPKPGSPQSGAISSELAKSGIRTFPVLDFSALPDLESLRALCSGFDLVVANTLVMWAAVSAAREQNLPVIWYIHETELLKPLLELNPEIGTALTQADLLVFPTEHTTELYRGLTPRRIEVLPYGIPAARDAPAVRRRARIHFLLLGSYEARKGQDLFLQAILELPAKLQEQGLFEMVGRKLDEPFFQSLTEQSPPPNVLLSDPMEHEAALALLAEADVLVCASRDETMPIAILEAMSLGKAIITTDVGGTTEWLRDEQNALIVPSEESAALARALRRCIEEPALRRSLGKNACRTFASEFSLDRLGERFTALVRRTVREKKP